MGFFRTSMCNKDRHSGVFGSGVYAPIVSMSYGAWARSEDTPITSILEMISFNRTGRNAKRKNKRPQAKNVLAIAHKRTDTLERSMPVFPPRKRAYLTYHTNIDLFCGSSGVVGNYLFAANGLYDPDITGTGHQPMGFDQMMVFYYHYTVLSSKITVSARNNGTNPGYAAVSRNGSSTAVTVSDDLVEAGNIEYRLVNTTSAVPNHVTIKLDMDISKFSGVDDLLDDDTYRGDSGSNPTDLEYFHISWWSPFTASSFTCNFDVVIEFEAMFTEPKKPSASLATTTSQECKHNSSFDTWGTDPPSSSLAPNNGAVLTDEHTSSGVGNDLTRFRKGFGGHHI